MSKIKDLTGLKFNRLTVIRFLHVDKKRNSIWLCRCDCGKEKAVRGYELTSGGTKSCRLFAKGESKAYRKDTRDEQNSNLSNVEEYEKKML